MKKGPRHNQATPKRQPIVAGGVAFIPLTQGFAATVDVGDAERLARYNWTVLISPHKVYAYRAEKRDGKRLTIYMHREVLDPPAELYVDHINGNGLDNRRENLRVATNGQNQANSRAKRGTASGLKGAYWHAQRQKWVSQINKNGRTIHIGLHDTAEAAHEAYCRMAERIHGEFANSGK